MDARARAGSSRTAKALGGLAVALALGGCGDRNADQGPAPAAPTQVAAIDTPAPPYPMELACAGVGGTVTLALTIGVEGSPTEVRLVNGSGNDGLDQVALEGVKSWKFRPATRNGQAHPQPIQVPVNFKVPQVRPEECFSLDAQR